MQRLSSEFRYFKTLKDQATKRFSMTEQMFKCKTLQQFRLLQQVVIVQINNNGYLIKVPKQYVPHNVRLRQLSCQVNAVVTGAGTYLK